MKNRESTVMGTSVLSKPILYIKWPNFTMPLYYTANIYHPAIVKLQPKADIVKEKIYNLIIKGI